MLPEPLTDPPALIPLHPAAATPLILLPWLRERQTSVLVICPLFQVVRFPDLPEGKYRRRDRNKKQMHQQISASEIVLPGGQVTSTTPACLMPCLCQCHGALPVARDASYYYS